MITFKEFLYEDEAKPEEHSMEEAVQIFKQRCHDWKNPAAPLWRMSKMKSSANIARKPTSRSSRKRLEDSIAGTADVQQFIFAQPGWDKFPTRKKSVFCSTNKATALGSTESHHTYAIYPYNGVKMGFTEAEDFNLISVRDGKIDIELRDLGEKLDNLILSVFAKTNRTRFTTKLDWYLEHVGSKSLSSTAEERTNFYKKLADLVTPENLKVKLITAKDIEPAWSNQQHEVWFEGRYLAIHEDDHEEFLKAL